MKKTKWDQSENDCYSPVEPSLIPTLTGSTWCHVCQQIAVAVQTSRHHYHNKMTSIHQLQPAVVFLAASISAISACHKRYEFRRLGPRLHCVWVALVAPLSPHSVTLPQHEALCCGNRLKARQSHRVQHIVRAQSCGSNSHHRGADDAARQQQ